MSVQTEIARIRANVEASYAAVEEKGGTVPESAVSNGLPAAIRSIPSGGVQLDHITITAPPAKTVYKAGETFDPVGMVVTATYSNGATLIATGYAVEPAGPLPDGLRSVTVRYTEGGVSAEATQPITVSPRLVALRIDTPPAKTAYRYGARFDPAGRAVSAVYSDGTTEAVSGYATAPEVFDTLGDQDVTVSYTLDGDTVEAVVAVTVGRAVVEKLPRQKGTPTYTGAVISPDFDGYDPDQLTLSGVTSATGAGSYEAVFTPTPFFEWWDGTTGAKTVQWSIAQAPGSLSLSTTAVTLGASAPSAVIQVDRAGTGAVSAVSSDTSVATVSVSGTQVTVHSVGQTNGTAVVTVSVAADPNYTAPQSVTCVVTAAFTMIFGATWDGSSTTKLVRTDDAALFTDPVPAVGTGAGSSPFDDIMPWSGMVRVTDAVAGELVAIPKYWVKVSHNPFKVQIANGPVEGFQVSPAHRDREDGHGERDVVYIGRYKCGQNAMSTSGAKMMTSVSLENCRRKIHMLGAEYWQADYALQLTWLFLYLVEFSDWDGQTAIGPGLSSNTSTSGMTDAMTYHTGKSSETSEYSSIQYRGIENPWSGGTEWRDGIIFSATNICTYNNPANFSDYYGMTGSVVRSNTIPTQNGYIKAWGYDSNDLSFIFPSTTGGSASTYIPDNFTLLGSTNCGLEVSGRSGKDAGPFYGMKLASNTASNYNGSRLMKLPNAA